MCNAHPQVGALATCPCPSAWEQKKRPGAQGKNLRGLHQTFFFLATGDRDFFLCRWQQCGDERTTWGKLLEVDHAGSVLELPDARPTSKQQLVEGAPPGSRDHSDFFLAPEAVGRARTLQSELGGSLAWPGQALLRGDV